MSEEKIGFMKVGALGLVLCGGWNLWPSNDLKSSSTNTAQVKEIMAITNSINSFDAPRAPEPVKVQQEPEDADILTVTASQFSRDWANNELKAAKKYSEPFQLTAKITKVLDQAHVILYVHSNTGVPIAISLKHSEDDKAMELERGSKITVICENAGNQMLSIFANECEIAD